MATPATASDALPKLEMYIDGTFVDRRVSPDEERVDLDRRGNGQSFRGGLSEHERGQCP